MFVRKSTLLPDAYEVGRGVLRSHPELSKSGTLPLALPYVPEDGNNNNYNKNYDKSTVLMSSHTRSTLGETHPFLLPTGIARLWFLGHQTSTVLAKNSWTNRNELFGQPNTFIPLGKPTEHRWVSFLNLVASKTLGLMIYSTALPERMTLLLKAFLGNSFSSEKYVKKKLWSYDEIDLCWGIILYKQWAPDIWKIEDEINPMWVLKHSLSCLHVHHLEYVILFYISYWNSSPGQSPLSRDGCSSIYSKYNTSLRGQLRDKVPAM